MYVYMCVLGSRKSVDDSNWSKHFFIWNNTPLAKYVRFQSS